jgi:hypothetical protein
VYTKSFTDSKTKNIWVYGLDDDEFEVKGNKKSNINIRLIMDKTMISILLQMVVKKIIDFKSKINSYAVDSKLENY